MNRQIVWSLAAATLWIAGAGIAAAQMGVGNGAGPGMMGAAAPATRARPNTAARPGYYGMGAYGPGARAGGGYGPGMMYGYGGYGPGRAGRYGGYGMGPGMMYGYGPGMMGGYGMGPGMMYGYGMGPGMMYGYGMGPGMMYGYGMAPGAMYSYGAAALGLSTQQRDKIVGIWNDTMQQSWPILGQLREQYFRFARLLQSENPDRSAVDKAWGQISVLQQKLLNLRLDARQEVRKVLTAEQRKQLQEGLDHRW